MIMKVGEINFFPESESFLHQRWGEVFMCFHDITYK